MEKVPSGGSSQATADGDKSANKSARTSLSFMARTGVGYRTARHSLPSLAPDDNWRPGGDIDPFSA